MIDTTVQTPYTSFKIGWGILVFFAVGNILGHIGLLLFDPGGKTIFLTWAAFNFLAAAILLIPYRRGEKWAWIAIWGMIIPYALIILFNTEVGYIYLAEAGLMALGQTLNYRVFFAKESGG